METSPLDPAYNCIAWALHDDTRWWWPMGAPDSFWPAQVPNEVTLEAFLRLFAAEGFERCESGSQESGFEKIALYVRQGVPRHAARQLLDGSWTSKLGTWIDIGHANPAVLEGGDYGEVTTFLRRPR